MRWRCEGDRREQEGAVLKGDTPNGMKLGKSLHPQEKIQKMTLVNSGSEVKRWKCMRIKC